MKVHCTQRELSKGISIVQRAVAARATLAILGNVELTAKDGQLRLAATNLNIAINCWIRADVVEEGAITVPARLFGDMVGRLLPGKVSLATEMKTMSVHLTCGNFKAKLAGLDAADFPQTSTVQTAWVELNTRQFGEMIDQVAFVASRDQSRQSLCCVHVTLGKRLTMAATDGFRLGVRSCVLESSPPEQEVLVPATSMAELGHILADADPEQPIRTSTGDSRRIVFGVEGKDSYVRAELSAQLVDAKYPDYNAIIPKSSTTTVAVDVATLLRSLQTARLLAKGDDQAITLTANPGGCLRVSAADGLMGQSADELDAEIKGEVVTIDFNVGFLIDVVSRLGNTQAVLELTNATRPIKVRPFSASPDEFIHVIMPMNRKK